MEKQRELAKDIRGKRQTMEGHSDNGGPGVTPNGGGWLGLTSMWAVGLAVSGAWRYAVARSC